MLWTLLTLALADPTVTVSDDGTVLGEALVPISAAELQRRIQDPAWVLSIDKSGTRIDARRPKGACEELDYVSPNVFLTVTYTVTACPTPTGIKATLVTSNAFDHYVAAWEITPEGAQAKARYRIELHHTLSFPQSFVRSSIKKAVHRMLDRIEDWAQAQGASPG